MSNIIGYPRIGENRELKKALEAFWSNKIDQAELEACASALRKQHWEAQKDLDFVCVNDFSYYDNVLDLAYALGAKPERFKHLQGLEGYFAMARGHAQGVACEMTKWFNTNYHYVVPELSIHDQYTPNISEIKKQYLEAKNLGFRPKISLIGIFSFLALSKIIEGDFESLFPIVKDAYFALLDELKALDSQIVIEFSEPIFVQGRDGRFFGKIVDVYDAIANKGIKTIVTTYFEHSNEATELLLQTSIHGIGLDFIAGEKNIQSLDAIAKSGKTLYAGIIDGRNIWVANLEEKLQFANTLAYSIPKNKIILSTSCSLLHVPFSKESETKIDQDILSWLSFANEKIQELTLLESVFQHGISAQNNAAWEQNKTTNQTRKDSKKTNDATIRERVASWTITQREQPFEERIKIQRQHLGYPNLATTTIGSFPQTPQLRALRQQFKKGEITQEAYDEGIKEYIRHCIAFQEEVGLDVLVHGEPERNDMVEYFGEQLDGFAFSQNGWVQSYGSRCVKPPIIYGDVARPKAMTTYWISYAQSLTQKIVKGMLTGPVTILNWSFVRDDLSRPEVCKQLALSIADEIDDLQKAGIKIIQVDEAAFKEGYPLRAENVKFYEQWALESFKIATSLAKPQTQIHTHMCYSEFNDIIKTIEALDADVISIETTRSGNALLKVFKEVGYTHEVGPGVYDIHSPRIPSKEEIKNQIKALLEVLPKEQLWINPDCGLKTRKWEEVKPSLQNLIQAVREIRS